MVSSIDLDCLFLLPLEAEICFSTASSSGGTLQHHCIDFRLCVASAPSAENVRWVYRISGFHVHKRVTMTKSVEFMPFHLSFFSFLASAVWMAYGLLERDLFLAAPNLLGCPMGFLQLVLYFIYRGSKEIPEASNGIDLENATKYMPQQEVVDAKSLAS
ncbi:bidirectional sugar transporter SWEET3b isoform X1 [Canna indica]|uniref:Sugar transporter SWEET1 n=1 Tax=Canna indica TaxID=4628 RepID=A0AAQ3JYP2_9LILI|nr:bidirectional sugar transporter SWEET3b isoform X1 [Canna indica]